MDYINVRKRREEIEGFVASIREWAVEAGRLSIKVVQANVIDITPVGLTKNLRSGILTREDLGGMSQAVYASGVVAAVMENNGQWTKAPPPKQLQQWVEGKLHIPMPLAARVAFLIGRKIKRWGLTLPNKQNMGKMFARTLVKMEQTGLWYHTFKAALRSLCR